MNQNMLMAIAFHMGGVSCIIYEAKNVLNEEYVHHLAYKELRELPKFNKNIVQDDYRASQHSLHS